MNSENSVARARTLLQKAETDVETSFLCSYRRPLCILPGKGMQDGSGAGSYMSPTLPVPQV